MKNFKQARENMVDSQIHPQGVVSEKILNAFTDVPREAYVPDHLKSCAYADEDLEIAQGRFLMEPQLQARLLEALNLNAAEAVLDIACGTGYSSAILSHLCGTVIALEEDETLLERAKETWNEQDICTVVPIVKSLSEGHADSAPYQAIFINGAVSHVPPQILSQLAVDGRLACIIRRNKKESGQAILIERTEENIFAERVLFDAFTPYLLGLEPKDEFKF